MSSVINGPSTTRLSIDKEISDNDYINDCNGGIPIKTRVEYNPILSSSETICDAANETICDSNKCNIFRFKFRDDFMIELSNFSKIHQYDSRGDFKKN